MSYNKFTITGFQGTSSGYYAGYLNSSGTKCWTADFGFKVGDIVEQWDWDGCVPSKMTVNGKVIWTEKDRERYYAIKEQRD